MRDDDEMEPIVAVTISPCFSIVLINQIGQRTLPLPLLYRERKRRGRPAIYSR